MNPKDLSKYVFYSYVDQSIGVDSIKKSTRPSAKLTDINYTVDKAIELLSPYGDMVYISGDPFHTDFLSVEDGLKIGDATIYSDYNGYNDPCPKSSLIHRLNQMRSRFLRIHKNYFLRKMLFIKYPQSRPDDYLYIKDNSLYYIPCQNNSMRLVTDSESVTRFLKELNKLIFDRLNESEGYIYYIHIEERNQSKDRLFKIEPDRSFYIGNSYYTLGKASIYDTDEEFREKYNNLLSKVKLYDIQGYR